jgi:uncharacterized protein (DUF2237 family)
VIYSILGVKLFWNVAPFDPIITPNANFKSFGFATSMLVRCMMVLRRARAHARARPTSRASPSALFDSARSGDRWCFKYSGPAWDADGQAGEG